MLGIPLKEIIEDLLIEEERDTKEYYAIYLHHAINGLRDTHRKVNGLPKTEKLTVNSVCTAPIPQGCVKLNRVYVVTNGGSIIPLTESDNRKTLLDDCGQEYRAARENWYFGASNTFSADHFVNGEPSGGFFGMGGGSIAGDFYVNKEANTIEFSSIFRARYVFCDFIGSVERINGQFRVHEYLRPVIKNYIMWMKAERKSGVSRGEKMALKNEYYQSLIEAKMEIIGESQDTINDQNSLSFHQTPKIP